MKRKEWYGAKTIYLVNTDSPGKNKSQKLYEERIIVLKARSFDDAIQKAEEEALVYADEASGFKYLGYVNVFKLYNGEIEDKTEVFSLMRTSKLNSKKYIDKHFDTGTERVKHL